MKYKVTGPDGREYVFSTLKRAQEYIRNQEEIYTWRKGQFRLSYEKIQFIN